VVLHWGELEMTGVVGDALHLFDLTGRRAIVMGVGALGRALSAALASAGASLLLVDGDAANLEKQAQDLRARFRRKVECLAVSPTDEASALEMTENAVRLLGGLDILFVTVGKNIVAQAVDMRPAQWDEVMNTNVRVSWLAARAAARVMIAGGKGGKIVLTSSVRGRHGLNNYSAYVPAKHAIDGLVRSLACEWAPHKINVNALGPVIFRSDLTAWMFSNDEPGASVRANMLNRIPLGRLAEPEDFAGAAVFLCSPASDFYTGQILYVDGGYTAC
jgi:NAD(P)-dependent dehydrogenase (short-subunit alcohol dehydrogenase family)